MFDQTPWCCPLRRGSCRRRSWCEQKAQSFRPLLLFLALLAGSTILTDLSLYPVCLDFSIDDSNPRASLAARLGNQLDQE
jgi:hypothetical protein